jgi:hypothetical protein
VLLLLLLLLLCLTCAQVRAVLGRILDGSRFEEFKSNYGKTLVTGELAMPGLSLCTQHKPQSVSNFESSVDLVLVHCACSVSA